MMEMQGIRNLHCTVWTEGVREIVSAEDAGVKFIVSDSPVTIYNYAVPPAAALAAYPNDPGIALKASQTLFPLSRDFCLILTNLEYANDPNGPPFEKRTFARNYRSSMVSTVALVRTRKFSDHEVAQVNFVLKSRARRYIAAGREEWLYPEARVTEPWANLRDTLLPKDELWHFGGELYAKFDDGHVHYQDAFGRTEKPREFLIKPARAAPPKPGEPCGCGSGQAFRLCCKTRPAALRPSWAESSIRERNLNLYRGIVNILGLDAGKDDDPPRAHRRADSPHLSALPGAVADRNRSLEAPAQARRSRPRGLYRLHPPRDDRRIRARCVALFRRAHHRAPLHPCRRGHQEVQPGRTAAQLSSRIPEDRCPVPQHHAARRSRPGEPDPRSLHL
jgi:hypothetical protein